MIAYEIRELTKVYPRQRRPANDGISLEIREGEIFGLLGDNGAGKTTAVRQMVGVLAPTSGSIALFGKDVRGDPLHVTTHVGYMPQEARPLNNATVGASLVWTARLRGLSRRDAAAEGARLLEQFGLGAIRDKPSSRLSGGERRLMRLAVALAGRPPVLILDEPTNDLAPQRRRMVWELLGAMNREAGTTVIFITHDAIEAERAIQRVGILREGKLVAVGAPGALKKAVDRKVRLELFFEPAAPPWGADARRSEGLGDGAPREVAPGRWLMTVERADVGAVLERLDLAALEDFHIRSATLEDLYVYYTEESGG